MSSDAQASVASASRDAWWSPRRVPEGQTLTCRIGPLTLQVHHTCGEWHLASCRDVESAAAGSARLDLRAGGIEDDFERFIFARADLSLRLVPLLVDRPVVITPRQSVYLPSGETITLYLSSPVILRVEVGDPPVLLHEVATVALSDTWFGPSTREGELCYSGKTHARHSLAEVPRRAHRAITPVRIRNDARTPLPLDKISLPVPVLSVYGTADDRLWTQGVSLVRASESDMAALKIDAEPPRLAGPVELISGPRQAQVRGGLVRAFDVLFGAAS